VGRRGSGGQRPAPPALAWSEREAGAGGRAGTVRGKGAESPASFMLKRGGAEGNGKVASAGFFASRAVVVSGLTI